jgi:two-component system cell cycle response regulator
MKILVLDNDITERSVIQQVLQRNGHQVVMAADSQAAWGLLQSGGLRFVIVDRTNTDADEQRFVERLRSARLPAHIYILLISTKGLDLEPHTATADDYLYKPLSTADLKARVVIGERILSLGDNLLHAKSQLETLALLDPQTNLFNRKAFLSSALGELERARRGEALISLLMLDIDNFEPIRTVHGQEISNDMLKLVAQIIREKSRPYDCIGRWETAAFALALPDVIGADAEKIAMRVITSVRSMNIAPASGSPLNIQMSAGVAVLSHITAATTLETLIEQAHQAMLRARAAGGNQAFLAYI